MDSLDAVAEISAFRAKTLPGIVYAHLHRMIISGEFAPGEKLNEVELARRLNVSRGPIREACRQLLQSGLLQAEAQKGFRVASYSVEEAEELTVVRAELAALVGRLAADRVDDADLAELRGIVGGMRTAVERRSLPDYFSLSFSFYQKLCDVSANSKLKEFYTDLCCRTRLFRLQAHALDGALSPKALGLLEIGITRRLAVLAALVTRDPEAAAGAMRQTVVSSLARNREFYLHALAESKKSRRVRAA